MRILLAILVLVSLANAGATREEIVNEYESAKKWAINHPHNQKTSLATRLKMLKEKRDRALQALDSKKRATKKKREQQNDQSKQIEALKATITEIDNFFIAKIKKESIEGYEAFAKQCKAYPNVQITEANNFLQCFTSKTDYIHFLEAKIKRLSNGNK